MEQLHQPTIDNNVQVGKLDVSFLGVLKHGVVLGVCAFSVRCWMLTIIIEIPLVPGHAHLSGWIVYHYTRQQDGMYVRT